jgi:hypothetical protein
MTVQSPASEADPHALFDPSSVCSRLRAEFDPEDKVFGYFLGKLFLRSPETLPVFSGRALDPNPVPMDKVATHDSNAERTVPTSGLEKYRQLVSFMPLAAGSRHTVAITACSRSSHDDVSSVVTPASKEDQRLSLSLLPIASCQFHGERLQIAGTTGGLANRECRVLLLSSLVCDRLTEMLSIDQQWPIRRKVGEFFSDRVMRTRRDVCRLIAALPEISGETDELGEFSLVSRVPEGVVPRDLSAHVLLVVDTR